MKPPLSSLWLSVSLSQGLSSLQDICSACKRQLMMVLYKRSQLCRGKYSYGGVGGRSHTLRAFLRSHTLRAFLRSHTFGAFLRSHTFGAFLRSHTFGAFLRSHICKRSTQVGPYPNVLPCFKPNFKAARFHKHAFTLGEVGFEGGFWIN